MPNTRYPVGLVRTHEDSEGVKTPENRSQYDESYLIKRTVKKESMTEENSDNNRTEGGSPSPEPSENARGARPRKRSIVSPDKLTPGRGPWKQDSGPSDAFRGYISEEASYEWSRACNYHRGVDLGHVCGNPGACSKRIAKAEALEMFQRDLAREWS